MKKLNTIKLCIIPQSSFIYDKKGYLTYEAIGNFIDRLAVYFKEIIICAPVFHIAEEDIKNRSTYRLQSYNINFCELPISMEVTNAGFIKTSMRYIKSFIIMYNQIRNWDLLYIFLPHHLSVISLFLVKVFSKPFFVYMAGNAEEVATYNYRWRKGIKKLFLLIYVIVIKIIYMLTILIVKDAKFVLTRGEILYKKYRYIQVNTYRSAPIINVFQQNLYYREDTCNGKKIELLFVGGLGPVKGLTYLLDALSQLCQAGFNVYLSIVGRGEEKSKLQAKANILKIENRVNFVGYVQNGPLLFEIYRACDIFILPSLSEGFPRVLNEAMSQSIPIIATRVGGIEGLMKDGENALLVSPRSSEAIAKAVKRLIFDKELRQKLIRNGQDTAKQIIEKDIVQQIVSLLEKHF